MASSEPFEKHRKLLLYIAHRVHRRCMAAGARSLEFDDIFSELCIAWCIARDSWMPEITQKDGTIARIPFGPYLMRGMSNHINRFVENELKKHFHLAPFDLDAELSDDGGVVGTLHDTTADESFDSPEDVLVRKDLAEWARDSLRWKRTFNGKRVHAPLSPQVETFLRLMQNPPPSIMAILDGLQARAEYARKTLKIGSVCAPKRVNKNMIFDLMGIDNREERAEIFEKVEWLGKRVNQQ
jgi:hypothetical protein